MMSISFPYQLIKKLGYIEKKVKKKHAKMSNILYYSSYNNTMHLVRRINETDLVDYFILFILHRQLLRTGIQF